MKPSFIFFIVVLVLGFALGFQYHEALDIKVTFERDQCYDIMNEHLSKSNRYERNDMYINQSVYQNLNKTILNQYR